jgi:HK97 family phage major capsid protein
MSVNAAGSSFWGDLRDGLESEHLLRAPVYEASAMDSAVTTGSNLVLAGDFQKYLIVSHVLGPRIEYLPNLYDQATGRPTAQRGWIYFDRVGGICTDPTQFSLLRL